MEKNIICTIYSHHDGVDKIIDIIKKRFTKGKLDTFSKDDSYFVELINEGGIFSSLLKLIISYRERKELSYKFPEEDDSPLTTNLKGMYGFVSTLQTKNEEIKSIFMKKISTLNSEFSVEVIQGKEKDTKSLIEKLVKELEGIVFVPTGSVISKSKTQHFLDENLKLIIDMEGNCDINKLNVNIESKYFDADESQLTSDQIKRKGKSEEILRKNNVKINTYLPCIESEKETIIRTSEEIARRVTVLAVANFVAFDNITGEEAMEYLKKYDLWDYTTQKEKQFLTNPNTKSKQNETWKCECIWVLMWALKKVKDLKSPKDMCMLNEISSNDYPIGDDRNPNVFINSITESRSKEEIMDMNDLYYRYDWACVDARINNKQMRELNSGVVYERHYALNWLINYGEQEWDEITCDT